ncbi:arginase family protein [bacterium]|nr:arginase family protein [bacterium]
MEIAPSKHPRYVLIPLPFDAGSSRPGSRHAPRAVLDASQTIEWYDECYDVNLEHLPYRTHDPVVPRPREKTRAYLDRVRAAARTAYRQNAIPIGLGGEHTLLVPLVEALVESRPKKDFSVVVFDAHSDLRKDFEGNPWSHACSSRRVLEMGIDVTVVGLRSLLPEHRDAGARLIFPEDIRGGRWKRMLSAVKKNIYVSIDIDVLDLGIMPAATNPEPGGLTWSEFTDALTLLFKDRNFLAGDVVEYCPPAGPAYAAVTTARALVRLIALAERSRSR